MSATTAAVIRLTRRSARTAKNIAGAHTSKHAAYQDTQPQLSDIVLEKRAWRRNAVGPLATSKGVMYESGGSTGDKGQNRVSATMTMSTKAVRCRLGISYYLSTLLWDRGRCMCLARLTNYTESHHRRRARGDHYGCTTTANRAYCQIRVPRFVADRVNPGRVAPKR